jgi:hypothetical protein
MTKPTDQQIEKIIANSSASLEMEGLEVTEESKERTRRLLKSEITMEDIIEEVLKNMGLRRRIK